MSDEPMPAWAAAMEERLAKVTLDVRTDLLAEIALTRAELKAGVASVKGGLRTPILDEIAALQDETTRVDVATLTRIVFRQQRVIQDLETRIAALEARKSS